MPHTGETPQEKEINPQTTTTMIAFWNTSRGLRSIENWEPGCWAQVTCPTEEDIKFLENNLSIPGSFLSDIADTDERARYDFDEGWTLIILRIPYVKEVQSRAPYTTVPLGIVMRGNVCITVCNYETNMMADFINHQFKRGLGFTDAVDMVFRIFLSSSVWYLKILRQISSRIDEAKQHLVRKINNKDLMNLSRLQDSLTYFVTSIRGNETLLAKLKFKLPIDELDADLIEDVNIEMNQAREMTGIYTNILSRTMDTYANLINNNMADIMKTLTSVSIILMFPTLISSFFGMNLMNGMEASSWGFPVVFVLTFVATTLIVLFFRRRTWI